METRDSRGFIAEALSGTAAQRGMKLGIIAGCVAIFLLFGASALQSGSSNTINLESGQITALLLIFLPGFLALVIAAVLAYYAGLSAPAAKSGEGGREGLIAGSITMLGFWGGQTLFVVIDGIRSPQGLEFGGFLQSRLITAILFFVVGGVLGWGGSRAAARRARSILAPPTSGLLSLPATSAASESGLPKLDKSRQINQPSQPEQSAAASSANAGMEEAEMASQEAAIDAPDQESER
jgi:hypothetical protein